MYYEEDCFLHDIVLCSSDQGEVKAHKMILAAQSGYFKVSKRHKKIASTVYLKNALFHISDIIQFLDFVHCNLKLYAIDYIHVGPFSLSLSHILFLNYILMFRETEFLLLIWMIYGIVKVRFYKYSTLFCFKIHISQYQQ